ncbi:MAG: aminodeoxychorismate synthase component I [Thermogutta sp.]
MSAGPLPLIHEAPYVEIETLLPRWAELPYCAWLDAAAPHEATGRFSFLAADPYQVWTIPPGASASLALRTLQEAAETVSRANATSESLCPSPFQGGLICLWSYELGRYFEERPIPAPPYCDQGFPLFWAGLYDVVLAIDHRERRSWLISQGFPAAGPIERRRRAEARANRFRILLDRASRKGGVEPTGPRDQSQSIESTAFPPGPVRPVASGLWSNFSKEEYPAAVRRIVRYIRAGDVFQVNLSQRLYLPASCHPLAAYTTLRRKNPAPMGGYLDLGGRQLLSTSPERLARIQGRRVETRPIKGTRPRHRDPARDAESAQALACGEKERAENTMIVDLLRNDLSRVSRADGVHVTAWNRVESYAGVHHLVSVIESELLPDKTWRDVMQSIFPGGSITGAPKIRAMEIIAELEPHARGPYCGSLGYVSYSGQADFNILIRTVLAERDWWIVPVGGGVTAQSDPAEEYAETWHKARAMVSALNGGLFDSPHCKDAAYSANLP